MNANIVILSEPTIKEAKAKLKKYQKQKMPYLDSSKLI